MIPFFLGKEGNSESGKKNSDNTGPKIRLFLIRSDWKDRKRRLPIHYKLDGVCLNAFPIVSRIESVVFVVFGVLQTQEIRAGLA